MDVPNRRETVHKYLAKDIHSWSELLVSESEK